MSDSTSALGLERLGTHSYIARNERGAEVRVGTPGTAGAFAPGELLQLALAACASLSADHTLASKLGSDFSATVGVNGSTHAEDNRYETVGATIQADMSSLSAEEVDALVTRAQRAIERLCTIGHTIDHGAVRSIDIVPA
ncbi:OsmC family protein [Microbacterium sediminicola]|uniref:OsmC family protein n=1 Tax=Microbacterium sediminicola TaxID=415210 RepID=A0ABN2IIH0_9MICO